MDRQQLLDQINRHYSALASAQGSLSCGGAVRYAGVRRGQTAIDLGSGRGQDVLRLAEAVGPSGAVYGVDAADGMIERAERDAARRGVRNAHFVKSELEAIDLPAELADVVISNGAFSHAHEKPAAWRELFRVLKPGGRFVVSDIYATEEVPAEFRDDTDAVARGWGSAVTREQYLAVLQQCGFVELATFEESEPYVYGPIDVVSFTIAGRRPLS